MWLPLHPLLLLVPLLATAAQLPLLPLPDAAVDAELPDPSHLVFASFVGLLKQWPNTFYPNGHSIVLGTVPSGTLLYHARKDAELPPAVEWLAFDAEISYGIMSGRCGETQLLTYAARRPLRALYFDGQSAALGDSGWLDTQSILIYGNVSQGDWNWSVGEYARATALCKLGREWEFDGVVRMNAGFELLFCDFNEGIDLVNRVNVTDPFSSPGMGFPSPPDSPDRQISLLSRRAVFDDPPPPFPDRPRGPGGPGGPGFPGRGRYPYGSRSRGGPPGRGQTSPFASSSNWEWQRSATWHYHQPERRVVLDPSAFFSFYDPAVVSLAQKRLKDGTENTRDKQRILGVESREAERVREDVRRAVQEKNRRGWGKSRQEEGGVDWVAVAESVVEQYGDRLQELRWTLRSSNETNGNGTSTDANGTVRAIDVRRLTYALLVPYVDMTFYSSNYTTWIDSGLQNCLEAFTGSPSVQRHPNPSSSPSEVLVRTSIEGFLGRICRSLGNTFGESILLDLPVRPDLPSNDPEELETRAFAAVARWRVEVADLMLWLGWSTWGRCEDTCALNEVCTIPMWPLGGFG